MDFRACLLFAVLSSFLPAASRASGDQDSLEREADLAAKTLESKCDDIKLQRRDEFLNRVIRPLNAKFDARIERNQALTEEVTWRFKKYRVTVRQPSGASPGEVNYVYQIRDVSNAEKSFQEVVLTSVTEPCRSFQTGIDPNAVYALSTPGGSDQAQDELNRARQVIADFNLLSSPSAAPSPAPRRRNTP
jgi:hypothetical protein